MTKGPLKAGVLGTGTIATSSTGYFVGLNQMKEKVIVQAVADPVVERATSVAKANGVPYTRYVRMLLETDLARLR